MDLRLQLLLYLCVVLHPFVTVAVTRPTAITINNNGYSGVLVAIHPNVPHNPRLVDNIKAMLVEASSYLYTATEKRAYLESVTILVPSTWNTDPAWQPATSELYSNADVVVQDPLVTRSSRNAQASHSERGGAYTRSYGGCGQSGVRINLFTDIFGTMGKIKYGPSGRIFVHEWAHFRWGVFDEYAEEGEPQFYFSPTTGQLEAVRCNIHMRGRIYRKDPVTGRGVICSVVDPNTGMYDEECVYNPYTIGHFNDNITASIMDRQQVPTIVNFCNDDHADPTRTHNYEAPSRHNRLCGSRSTWAVISESDDFKGGKNPPGNIADTTPKIKVVRMTSTRRMVLAIDNSASMEANEKLTRARQAATSFIEDGVDEGTPLGVVSFSSKAQMISPIASVTDEASRKNITCKLPKNGEGETSVGAALLKSLHMLQHHDQNASDAFIVMITDGQETTTPYLDDVINKVKQAGAVVSIIAFADDEARSLEKLASETGGRYYFDTNEDMSTSAMDAMLDIYRLFDSGKGILPVQIVSQASLLSYKKSMAGSFLIDDSLGDNTRIIFTYTSDSAPIIVVTSPTGRRYCSLYPEYSHDPLLKRVKITIPFLAEVGRWTYSITNEDQEAKKVSIGVLSSGRHPDTPALKFTGDILVQNNSWPIRSTIVAEVTRGEIPVRDLRVIATVTRPMAPPHVLELYDQGAGADAVKQDGIFSRYFTRFTVSGHYSVNIEMMNLKGDVVVSGGLNIKPSHIATAYAGSIHIENPNLPSSSALHYNTAVEIDEYPPMRITDLRVLYTSSGNGTVVLAWTAPGDDGDFDKASFYTLIMSSAAEAIVTDEDLPAVDKTFIIEGDLESPKPFGEKEQIKLKLHTPDDSKVSMVFAVFAVDEAGNKGELSNLVTVGFGFVPDINTAEYMQEGDRDTETDDKAPPKDQKYVIAGVVGSAAALLALTVITTFIIHFISVRNQRKREMKTYLKEKSQIV